MPSATCPHIRVVDRRAFLAAVAGVLVRPLAAEPQPGERTARIGLLSSFFPADSAAWHEAFRQGLRSLGWVEGKNISIEYRYAQGRHERLPELAADLVRLKVDLIVTAVTGDAVAAKAVTTSIPIVMAASGDPVATGLVQSLARPAGNITGLSQMNPELVGKRLQLLREMVPRLARVAVFWNPRDRSSTVSWKEAQVAARRLGLQVHSVEVREPDGFGPAFDDAARARAQALAIMPDPVFVTNLRRLADLATGARLPSVFHLREFAEVGGLVAYGIDRADMFRRAAGFVDKILKGARPGDLPIEQPTKFELAINKKTAQALGLAIPPSLLQRADQVID